ncbi:hypothetical protein GLA29479_799 [Lysobacter antibioticus]|nr:hypothetical protein GLA29479_799 [Lysobacter antibioticus]
MLEIAQGGCAVGGWAHGRGVRRQRAVPHARRPSVLLPESLKACCGQAARGGMARGPLLSALASCPFGAGSAPLSQRTQAVSPEFCTRGGMGPERLRALRLRQRAWLGGRAASPTGCFKPRL